MIFKLANSRQMSVRMTTKLRNIERNILNNERQGNYLVPLYRLKFQSIITRSFHYSAWVIRLPRKYTLLCLILSVWQCYQPVYVWEYYLKSEDVTVRCEILSIRRSQNIINMIAYRLGTICLWIFSSYAILLSAATRQTCALDFSHTSYVPLVFS